MKSRKKVIRMKENGCCIMRGGKSSVIIVAHQQQLHFNPEQTFLFFHVIAHLFEL
jgi:hypothetical protein